jgi:tetratricopeptide (TPR) repeat protein
MTSITTGNLDASNGGVALVGNNNQITVNYQKSQDWQDFLTRSEKLRGKVAKYPDDADFRHELAELEQQMEAFKRDVLKLAEDINTIPLNTERLKLAVQYFNADEYAQARAVLDVPELAQEQDDLLARQRQLNAQQAKLQAALDDKANEYLLLAQLRAIDYSLGEQRIAKTREAFEQALKSGRTSERLFKYAKFLQENNQFKPAEDFYTEALNSYRKLAAGNPSVYLPDVATTLNNLGNLVAADSNRRQAAETLYNEALDSYRKLAADNPSVYLPDVVKTLGGFGLAHLQWGEPAKARVYLQEAADIIKPFAAQHPNVYGGLQETITQWLAKANSAAQ